MVGDLSILIGNFTATIGNFITVVAKLTNTSDNFTSINNKKLHFGGRQLDNIVG
jgi:hypothetical protein